MRKRNRLFWLRANAAGLKDEVKWLKSDYLSQISSFWRYSKMSALLTFYLIFVRIAKKIRELFFALKGFWR